jgi:hypothetical protein
MDDLTGEEQRQAGRDLSRNPFTRAFAEAMVMYQCEGKLDGFTSSLAREGIRKRFGDEGADRWDEMTAKIVEALRDETTDPGQLE